MSCDYIQRRYFCAACCIGVLSGFGTIMYGVSNLPTKLPDTMVNYGGTIISQPNGGSAQDLQDYIRNSYEYKLIVIGGIVMVVFIVPALLLAWVGLAAPVVRRRRNATVLPVEVKRPTLLITNISNDIHNNNAVPAVDMRIRAPSSSSPQLTQAKHNRWKTNEIV